MELSKDEPIFKTIDNLKQYIGINSVTLKFHNNTDWTETEFNNFTSVLRNNYREIIDEEILEISIDKNYLTISKIANILNYCTTNNYSNINEIIINNNYSIDNYKTIFDKYNSALFLLEQNAKQIIPLIISLIINKSIILLGVGKSGLIAQKCISTWNSMGIIANSINVIDLFHGEFGKITDNSIIIYISNSGNTEELIQVSKHIKKEFNIIQIVLSNNSNNNLRFYCDYNFSILNDNQIYEIDELNKAPTTSSFIFLAFLDILGVELRKKLGIDKAKRTLDKSIEESKRFNEYRKNNPIPKKVKAAMVDAPKLRQITEEEAALIMNANAYIPDELLKQNRKDIEDNEAASILLTGETDAHYYYKQKKDTKIK